MLTYTKMLLETCFDYKDQERLMQAFGGALYRDRAVMGKVFILYGPPESGKTTILEYFREFSGCNTQREKRSYYYDNCGIIVCQEGWPIISNKKQVENIAKRRGIVLFATTNKLPEDLPDNVKIIKFTGDRLAHEDYFSFKREMFYFKDEFFRKCMIEFSLAKEHDELVF